LSQATIVPAMPVAAPTTVDEVVAALAEAPHAHLLAGGTDLLVAVNAGSQRPQAVVSLHRVDELRSWSVEGGVLRLGAGVTYTQMLSVELAALAPALAEASRTVGSPQIRNAGTIGGNLATASPAGDALPVLVALGAVVEVAGPAGRRRVPIDELLVGPKRTSLQNGEVLAAVEVPVAAGGQAYLKVGVRNAMVIAVASVAVVVDEPARRVGVGLGSVGPTTLRSLAAEAVAGAGVAWDFTGTTPVGVAAAFGAAAAADARPIDDHRSTSAYRRHAVEVLARRGLERVLRMGS
jgi:CO/xanthine dehydrogenase FAD-binding subunit